MHAEAVVELVGHFERCLIDVWIDGGWGVDALLTRQTRPHGDLDIVLRCDHLEAFNSLMSEHRYLLFRDDGPCNWVVANHSGDQIDIHLVDLSVTRLDRFGIEVYGPAGLEYEAGCLDGVGWIHGRMVRCCTADYQVRSHTGYALKPTDYQDVLALHQRFGVHLPWPYDPDGDRTDWASRMSGVN